MFPESATNEQIERYRTMTGEERLRIALNLHELSCNIARESIRAQYPESDDSFIEEKLRQRLRAAHCVPTISAKRATV